MDENQLRHRKERISEEREQQRQRVLDAALGGGQLGLVGPHLGGDLARDHHRGDDLHHTADEDGHQHEDGEGEAVLLDEIVPAGPAVPGDGEAEPRAGHRHAEGRTAHPQVAVRVGAQAARPVVGEVDHRDLAAVRVYLRQIVGVHTPGAYAEYLSIPVTNIWYCDPHIPMDILTCFDPLGNATHTALSFDVLGEDVLITGAGPIGCMAAAIAKHAGARYVVVTDVIPYRLKLAKKMGATLALDVRTQKVEDAQKKLGMKEGFDVGLEMSGNPDALRSMLANMCHGGKVAMLGILPKETAIDWDLVIFNGLTLKGIYGREMYETWYKMTVMIQSGLDISPMITHRFDYTEYEKAFKIMRSGKSGKVILNWID